MTDPRRLVEAAERYGADVAEIQLIRGPEPWEEIPVPERLARSDRLWDRAIALTDEALPLRYAELWQPEDLGPLGLALRTAPTLGEGCERIRRYHELFFPLPMWTFHRGPEGLRASTVWAPPLAPRTLERTNEFLSAALFRLLEGLAGPLPVVEVTFAHPPRTPLAALESHFRAAPRVGPATSFLLAPGAEALPFRTRDDTVAAFVLGELDPLVASDVRLRDGDLLLERLRTEIRRRLADGLPPIGRVARQIGTSERTLRRRLEKLGTTWADLVDRTRFDLAKELLASGEPTLAEISFLLGFSEPSAFHRAFRRWAEATPTEWRERTLGA